MRITLHFCSKQSQKGSEQIWSGNSRPERNLNGVSTWKGQNREHREAASKPVMQNNSSKVIFICLYLTIFTYQLSDQFVFCLSHGCCNKRLCFIINNDQM